MQHRDPEFEKQLVAAAKKSLLDLAGYYDDVRLRGPMRLTGKALSLLDFIKIQGGAGRSAPGRDGAPLVFPEED